MRILSRIRVNADRIEDILGAVAIFAMAVCGIWIAYGIGWPTGGDQLVGVR